jgi:hypothetical protein
MAGSGSAIDESARVGRILQNRREHTGRWCTPDDVTKPVAPRQGQCVVPEAAHHFTRRPKIQKRRKDQGYPILHLLIRIFMYYAVGVTLESCRQQQRQFTALCLVQQSGRQAATQCV